MRVVFNRVHKSIADFEPLDLPNFTVLTGVNGAGKSHFLEAIESNAISVEGVEPNCPERLRLIRRFDWNSLVPQDTGSFSAANLGNEQIQCWNEIFQQQAVAIGELNRRLTQFGSDKFAYAGVADLRDRIALDFASVHMPVDQIAQEVQTIERLIKDSEASAREAFVRNDPVNRGRLVTFLDSQMPCFGILTIQQDEFYQFYPKKWLPVDLFQQSFARLFTSYQRNWAQNKLKQSAQADGEVVDALSEKEFRESFGDPPWEFLNEIFKVAELDFEINAPHKWDDRPYEPLLTDTKRGTRVRFNDLSSGERVLMSFALCLYHAEDQATAAEFPRVLLLDEVDAPLHPSMTRSLLRTIQKTLVGKHGVFVILTTHSPSTVALAPNSSVYVMQKHGANRIAATSKDLALGILTAGVPTLSINYENRRQVFVESKHDVSFYSSLYETCKVHLLPDVSLMFIASAANGNGNCDQVKKFVAQLVAGGNRSIFGVIDWDLQNSSAESVFVLGEGERYSIENYVLDPLLIAVLLLREGLMSPVSLGLDACVRYVDLGRLGQNDLQKLSDAVSTRIQAPTTYLDKTPFSYINETTITAPAWWARLHGHDLEKRIKEAFPGLSRFHREEELKLAVLERVLGDYPGFMPVDVLKLFERIQKAGLENQA